MKKLLFVLSLVIISLYAVELPEGKTSKNTNEFEKDKINMFGSHLFKGEFSKNSQHRYNPDYILNIKDVINLKLWGAIDLEIKLQIDEQGNIFIPKVGTVNLLGVKNKDLTEKIKKVLKSTFKDNVYIYANLDNFQPVSVFVAGGAVKPGLYEGLSSDSILQFIDKAKGIENNGSYRSISIIRNNKVISKIDLYEYLLYGKLDMVQFKTGDIINIDYLKGYITVDGDVNKPMKIETLGDITIDTIKNLVQPYVDASHIIVSSIDIKNEKNLKMYSLNNKSIKIKSNQNVKFVTNNSIKTIEIKISGEHNGLNNIVVKKGTTLEELLAILKFSNLSSKKNINLYRKSVAKLQKDLIESSLKELESSVLKTGSSTVEESAIRNKEADLVLNFIKRAREIELKGRVILNKNSDFSKIVLEDEDEIFIPKRNHVVTVQGEVKIPSSLSYVENMTLDEYLKQCGGLSIRADEENILVIKQDGNVTTYENSVFSNQDIEIEPGDSILVLSKIDSKSLPIAKSITQILYQIAVSAGVLVRL